MRTSKRICKPASVMRSCDSAVHESELRPSDCVNLAIGFEMLDLLALMHVSAVSSAANVHVLPSTNLRSLLQQRVEEEQALESKTRWLMLASKKWQH